MSKTAFLLLAHKRTPFSSSTKLTKTSESVQWALLQNIIWFQLQRQWTTFFLQIRSQHKNIKTGPALLRFMPTSPPPPPFSPLCFSSLLWSFLPGYLFNLDYKLFEARASILRGLKSIIANLGHSIKELFINKAFAGWKWFISYDTDINSTHTLYGGSAHCPRKGARCHAIFILRIQC